MKTALASAAVAVLLAVAAPAFARDDAHMMPLKDVIELGKAEGKLDGTVQFYLQGQKTPKVVQKLSSDVSNKKTNSAGKGIDRACQWAALSALIAFQDKARQLGANAVIDLVSYYKKNTKASPTDYECHDGAFVTGVTLKGNYAKVAE
ncbi:excinuclease ATPase subunit [Dokdonella koreensis]|uniref:Excinuclease ATPase subunit protein n=1 Tax=Dokdonella koreensis DS-123 TaxID=1300342 RepID=A0A160DXU8_9GAMM|nr:excinuclease ATPase subunit [Dokdonella koreensis]ANB19384.1 Excinuclease ATPase subunit protein [Dokdonella koreensis DS-123]